MCVERRHRAHLLGYEVQHTLELGDLFLAGQRVRQRIVTARHDPVTNKNRVPILDLETLETRNSDRLDFHDLAVWEIRDALQAAYDAGRQSVNKERKTGR